MKQLPIIDDKKLYEIEKELRNTPRDEIVYSIPVEDVARLVKTITEVYESKYINPVNLISFKLADNYVENMGVRGSYGKKREMIDNILSDMTKYMLINNIEVIEFDDTDEGKEVTPEDMNKLIK